MSLRRYWTSEQSIITSFTRAIVILLVVVGLFAIAYFRAAGAADDARAAAQKSARTAECVNKVLAVRAVLSQADHDNENQKILDQKTATADQKLGIAEQKQGVLVALAAKTRAQALAGLAVYEGGIDEMQLGIDEFQRALDAWVRRDAAITKQKQLHPLGQC